MKVKTFFRWYDYGLESYIDKENKAVYVYLIPFKISYKKG